MHPPLSNGTPHPPHTRTLTGLERVVVWARILLPELAAHILSPTHHTLTPTHTGRDRVVVWVKAPPGGGSPLTALPALLLRA